MMSMQAARRAVLAIAVGAAFAVSTAPAAVGLTLGTPATLGAGAAATGGPHLNHVTITNIAGSQLTLQTPDGWMRVVDVTGVKITRDGQIVAVSSLHVGDRVDLRQTLNPAGAFVVTEIRLVLDHVHGVVTSIGAGSFVVRLKDNALATVTYDGSTIFRLGKDAATSGTLAVGLEADARGDLIGSTLAAVAVHLKSVRIGGRVTATTPSTITVRHGKDAPVTIHVTAATTFTLPGGAAASLATAVVGTHVDALGTWNADGSFNATSVRVHAGKAHAAKPQSTNASGPKPGVGKPKPPKTR